MQFSTLALSPGLCGEEGFKAGVTVFLSVVTDNTVSSLETSESKRIRKQNSWNVFVSP